MESPKRASSEPATQPVEPQPNSPGPSGSLTEFQVRHQNAWTRAETEFATRDWPFDIVEDAQAWASTWLLSDLTESIWAELAMGYDRGDIPALQPCAGGFIQAVIDKAVHDDVIVLPAPGKLKVTYIHRDFYTEHPVATGYGFYVAASEVLEVQSDSAIGIEQFGCLDGLSLRGAAALQRALQQVIDSMQEPVAFLKAAAMQ